jgi:hypothetical protein
MLINADITDLTYKSSYSGYLSIRGTSTYKPAFPPGIEIFECLIKLATGPARHVVCDEDIGLEFAHCCFD